MDLVHRVENLEEKLLEEREISEDLRFKIKQQDQELRDAEVSIH